MFDSIPFLIKMLFIVTWFPIISIADSPINDDYEEIPYGTRTDLDKSDNIPYDTTRLVLPYWGWELYTGDNIQYSFVCMWISTENNIEIGRVIRPALNASQLFTVMEDFNYCTYDDDNRVGILVVETFVLFPSGRTRFSTNKGAFTDQASSNHSYDSDIEELQNAEGSILSPELTTSIGPLSISPTEDSIIKVRDKNSIYIEKGKVFFEVLKDFLDGREKSMIDIIKNPREEFILFTKGIKVLISGTRFIIETTPEIGIDIVMVREGKIYVEGLVSGKAVLSAGSWVVAHNGILQQPEKLSQSIWRTNLREIKATPEPETVFDCHSLVGKWQWFNGAKVECFADGKCDASNGFSGLWTYLESTKKFKIRWVDSDVTYYIDTVSVNCHKGELQGKNQFGGHISASRLK